MEPLAKILDSEIFVVYGSDYWMVCMIIITSKWILHTYKAAINHIGPVNKRSYMYNYGTDL